MFSVMVFSHLIGVITNSNYVSAIYWSGRRWLRKCRWQNGAALILILIKPARGLADESAVSAITSHLHAEIGAVLFYFLYTMTPPPVYIYYNTSVVIVTHRAQHEFCLHAICAARCARRWARIGYPPARVPLSRAPSVTAAERKCANRAPSSSGFRFPIFRNFRMVVAPPAEVGAIKATS